MFAVVAVEKEIKKTTLQRGYIFHPELDPEISDEVDILVPLVEYDLEWVHI